MAENKKGFVLYANLIDVVSKLSDEKAGVLFKHILEYVNDMNPEADDLMTELLFIPIKQRLKADLDLWEKKKQGYSKAGKMSAEARKRKKETEEVKPVEKKKEVKPVVRKSDSDFKKESFDTFWNTYNKKEGRKKCFDKFMKLSKSEIEKILDVVKIYVSSTPDIKFRKNALTWLNGEHWNDEIEKKETKLTTANPKTKVDEVLQLFDQSEFKAIEEKYKSNKSRIKDRLKEFLEVQQIKAGFKNRANDELLYHFINSIQYNPPVRVIKRSNEPVPWLTKDVTGLVKPKY
jgi:hypothetical protein